MMKTLFVILILSITTGPAVAQCNLAKLILKRRLAGMDHRRSVLAAKLGSGESRMNDSGGGYQYNESYQPIQAAPQMQMQAPAAGYQYQQNYQQNFQQTYGSAGSQMLGAYSQYQVQPAQVQAVPMQAVPMAAAESFQMSAPPATSSTYQGAAVTQQHVETITQPAPIVTQTVAPQPATVHRQSYGSAGSAVTHLPAAPAGFQSVLAPFTYGTKGK